MGLDTTTFANLLKTQFAGPAKSVFEEGATSFNRVLKGNKKLWKGGNISIPVRTKRNWGGGASADGRTLPTASYNQSQLYSVDPKVYYWPVQVSIPAVLRSQGGKGAAYVEAAADEMEHALEMLNKRLNQNFWWGEKGYIGKTTGAASGDTLTLYAPGVAPGTNAIGQGYNNGVRFLFGGEGQQVDAIDSNGTTIHNAGLTVLSVNRTTNVVTFTTTPSASIAAGDFLAFKSGLTTSDSWGAESIEGIMPAIDDGTFRTTYHGLSRSTYPILNSVVLTSTSLRDLTEPMLEDLLKSIMVNCGEMPSGSSHEFTISPSLHSAFVATQMPLKRYAGKQLSAGYSGIDYNGIKFWVDPDHPFETLFCFDWSDIELHAIDGPDWADEDGLPPLIRTGTTDEMRGYLRYYAEQALLAPARAGSLRYLNDTPYVLRG